MTRDLCGEIKSISTAFLKKHGYFKGVSKAGIMEWTDAFDRKSSVGVVSHISEGLCWIKLRYTQTDWDGKEHPYEYQVPLTTTACALGGRRYWFICPLIKDNAPCNRRVGVIYIGGKYFGCRHCYQLGYRSQYRKICGPIAADFKIVQLADDIDEKLNGMRVKYWKGRPTKRYAKLLAETEALRRMSYEKSRDKHLSRKH